MGEKRVARRVNMFQCHFGHHKYHMAWPGLKHGRLRRETCAWQLVMDRPSKDNINLHRVWRFSSYIMENMVGFPWGITVGLYCVKKKCLIFVRIIRNALKQNVGKIQSFIGSPRIFFGGGGGIEGLTLKLYLIYVLLKNMQIMSKSPSWIELIITLHIMYFSPFFVLHIVLLRSAGTPFFM